MAGLYVHVPFCSQRCVYCDFYVTTTRRDEGGYVRALAAEAERMGAEYRDKAPLQTLYVGGGTPSLLSPDALAAVVGVAHDHFDTSGLAEVTVEANPEDLAGPGGGTGSAPPATSARPGCRSASSRFSTTTSRL